MEVEGGEMRYGHMVNQEHNHNVPSSAVNNNRRMMVRYRECLKNHAASIGGNATDGCGEFMPCGEDSSLTCSACNCHRNFHRKELQGQHSPLNRIGLGNLIVQGTSMHGTESFGYNNNNNIISNAGVLVPSRPMIMSYNLALGSLQTDSDEQQAHRIAKKRFRTKFTQEQKEKMLNFAEKVGWKIPKQEESVVQQFCQELGIKRRVLKVWMHNNKHNLAKNINTHLPTNPLNQTN